MAKSPNQKLKLLYLLDILKRKSDEMHPMSTNDLIEELEHFSIHAERKSIYDDMEQLRDFGYDIILLKSKQNGGYYLAEREFEIPELKLLVDSVQSSRFITLKKSRELISKLEKMCSQYDEKLIKRQVYVNNRVKTDNENIYYNVDQIYHAIWENRKITFDYYEWNTDKVKRKKKEDSVYLVSPFSLTWNEENYYLIAYEKEHAMIRHYRVDKMKNIVILDEKREGEDAFEHFDVASYCKKTFGMYGGKSQVVTLKMPDALCGVIIDRFGTEVSIRKEEKGQFLVRLDIVPSNQFFGWLAGIGSQVKIVSPNEIAVQYRNYLLHIIHEMDGNG